MSIAAMSALQRAYENRASLPPDRRAAVERAYEAQFAPDPRRHRFTRPEASPLSTAEVTFGSRDTSPADLDPVEAAAAPITPDPLVRPKPARRSPAMDTGTAAFQAVLEDVGGDYDEAIRVLASEHMQNGIDPERAMRAARARAEQHQSLSRDPGIFYEETGTPLPTTRQPQAPQGGAGQPVPFGAMPDADPRTTRAERLAGVDETAARWDRQKAAYDRATGLGAPDAISDEGGPYPGAGRPGYDRTFTPAELAAQRGDTEEQAPAGYTLPGPRTLDGKPVRKPQPLQTEKQASAYNERRTDPETGRRLKSQYDLDMEARGYTAVVTDNGTVGYYTTYAPATDEPTGRGAIGRAGDRPDLRNSRVPGSESPRYEPREMLTPTGERVQVWAPTQAADEYTKKQRNTAMRGRLADSAGLGAGEAVGLSDDDLRERVRASRMQDKQARADAWRAQSMLAGGQPTGGPRGTKAATNALLMMSDPSLTPEQRSSLRYMLPGGQLAAGVDAANMQAAARLAQGAIIGALPNMVGNPLAQAQMDQLSRDRAVARADALIAKYPRGWDGMYSANDVREVRDAVEKQNPGYGDAAVAHIRIRPAAPPPPVGGVAPGSVPPI